MYSMNVDWKGPFGDDRKGTAYFHLDEIELVELEHSMPGGFMATAKLMMETNDTAKQTQLFNLLMHATYGVRTAEGDFEKATEFPEHWRKFKSSGMFNACMLKLGQTKGEAVNFLKGIIPDSLRDKITDEQITKTLQELQMADA